MLKPLAVVVGAALLCAGTLPRVAMARDTVLHLPFAEVLAMPDAAQYECHAGGVVVGVTLKGDFAKIAP